jgi:hypothetical protein
MTPAQLLHSWPGFRDARLVKSDTDGYDARLIVSMARALASSSPVLFFEYDPGMARLAGDHEPDRVWDDLAGLGYERVAVWDNFGLPRQLTGISRVRQLAEILEGSRTARDHDYWDVAVVHSSDRLLASALEGLVSGAGGP